MASELHSEADNGPSNNFTFVAGAVLFWYASSISITAVNKVLFDKLGFNFPLLVTFVHFAFMSILLRVGFASLRFFPELPVMHAGHYLKYIVPIAFFSAAEIALSNLSYAMVSLSAMTVIKSSLAVVTYLLAVVFGLETFDWRLLGVIMLIVGSICFSVPGMEIKDPLGVTCLALAVIAAAGRWVIVHHQLQRHNIAPLQLMILTQPLATIFLAPPAVAWDLHGFIDQTSVAGIDLPRLYSAVSLITIAIFLACLLIFSEYTLVRTTSSVSLTVAGVGKEVATIFMSMVGFKEHITLRSVSGIACSIVGIVVYSRLRFSLMKTAQIHNTSDVDKNEDSGV